MREAAKKDLLKWLKLQEDVMELTQVIVRIRKVNTKLLEIRLALTVHGQEWSHAKIVEILEPVYQELDDLAFQMVQMDARKSFESTESGKKLTQNPLDKTE